MPDGALPRLRTWTVRSRIVGLLTALTFASVLSAGMVAYVVERTRVLEQIDTNLQTALESGSFTVANADWESTEQALSAVVQRLAPDDNTGTLGIIDGLPALVPWIETDVQLEELPGFVDRIVAETADHETVMGTYVHEDGTSVRYLAAPVSVGEVDVSQPPAAVFVTGYDVAGELAEITDAARVYVITGLVAVAGTFLVGLLVSGRLLRPIRRMSEVAERASASNLSDRIPVGDSRDDVSQLARTVNRMLDRLGGALDSQRELLRDVGHELKTPITIVRGHLELVDAADPADVAETRDLAIDELDRMARLVDDLRDAARLRDPSAFDIRPTDLRALTESIAAKARAIGGVEGAGAAAAGGDGAEADAAGPAIEPVVQSAPVSVMLDPDRVTQAMLQLVANALRHGRGPIAIGARSRGRDVELFVRDRGPGVPDDLKGVIFERFHRGSAEGRGDGGSGLGLSIVQLIAQTHGGAAWVADAWSEQEGGEAPRRGSEFIVTLPGAVIVDQGAHPHDEGRDAPHVPPPPIPTHVEEQPWHRS